MLLDIISSFLMIVGLAENDRRRVGGEIAFSKNMGAAPAFFPGHHRPKYGIVKGVMGAVGLEKHTDIRR